MPNYPEAYNNLGSILLRHHKFGEAEKCFRRTIIFKINYVETYPNLGCSLIELGQLSEAFECLRFAFVSDVSNTSSCSIRG